MSDETLNLPQPNPDQGSLELTEDYIRLRAYFLFLARGGEHGHDAEDWLAAEAEIVGKKEPARQEAKTPLEVAAARVAAVAA